MSVDEVCLWVAVGVYSAYSFKGFMVAPACHGKTLPQPNGPVPLPGAGIRGVFQKLEIQDFPHGVDIRLVADDVADVGNCFSFENARERAGVCGHRLYYYC